MINLPVDWSMGGLTDSMKGLLTDPNQMTGLLSNPMFNVGMGLLSARQDGSINPFQAAVGGLASAQQNKQEQEDRKRIEQLRKELAELIRQQSGGGPSATPPFVPGQPNMSPVNPMLSGLLG